MNPTSHRSIYLYNHEKSAHWYYCRESEGYVCWVDSKNVCYGRHPVGQPDNWTYHHRDSLNEIYLLLELQIKFGLRMLPKNNFFLFWITLTMKAWFSRSLKLLSWYKIFDQKDVAHCIKSKFIMHSEMF